MSHRRRRDVAVDLEPREAARRLLRDERARGGVHQAPLDLLDASRKGRRQLADALEDLNAGFGTTFPEISAGGKGSLPKDFAEIRFLMTRYEPGNDLHRAMFGAFERVFGERLMRDPIELTRAVEQSGRFLNSVYEMDYRDMTRETWRRARATFDRAYEAFIADVHRGWESVPGAEAPPPRRDEATPYASALEALRGVA